MAERTLEGTLEAKGGRYGLIVSRFNAFITERLLEGAVDCIVRHGGDKEKIDVIRVPGTWEMPVALKWMLETKRFDAIVALGTVIRGGTPHFDYVAAEAAKGVAAASAQSGVPVVFGVLTTDSIEQAIERAGTKMGNKGFDAAMAAIEMVSLAKALGDAGL